ncbi:MAG: U32 family peptidase [Methanomicrobiaceae archaeon]|nr:U32 family peptidase [Methanomicrobiaceae archaeon]
MRVNRPVLPELLAPAGSPEALRAAVAAGADAVYLGGRRFGARRYASNFDDEALAEAVRFCHGRDVRVYVTANTLVRDDELPDVVAYLLWLYERGVDAVLVQDMGVVSLARDVVPDLPLHASTQMTVHSASGVLRAMKMGISRVVLSRECPIEEITRIGNLCRGRDIGLEIFVHGALCYCYSGQCLFSSLVGGRSGNRGTCAQPCRKPYTLVAGVTDAAGRPEHMRDIPLTYPFILSPRDLALYPHLARIVRMPVASLKIEGRMKSPEYVAVVVDVYRRALDAIADGTWTPSDDDMRDLALAFNRSFTGGYLMGERGLSIIGPERPGNRGLAIGRIREYDRRRGEAVVAVEGTMPEPGDGIVVHAWGKRREDTGVVIRPPFFTEDGILRLRVAQEVEPGSPVSLTSRASLSQRAQRILAEERSRILPVDMHLGFEDGFPVLEGEVGAAGKYGGIVTVHGDRAWEPARSSPLGEAQIKSLLERTGGTPFRIRRLEIDYPGGLFAPVGEINRLRRRFLRHVEEAVVASFLPSSPEKAAAQSGSRSVLVTLQEMPRAAEKPPVPVLAAFSDTPETVREAVAGGCRRIYFEPPTGPCGTAGSDEALAGILDDMAHHCHSAGAECVWKWPRITGPLFRSLATRVLDHSLPEAVHGVMVEGHGDGETILRHAPDIALYGGTGLNVFNHRAAGCLARRFRSLTLSQELSGQGMKELVLRARTITPHPAFEIIVHGPVEMMVSEDCLMKTHMGDAWADGGADWFGIRDGRGHLFPVHIDGECRTHIQNARETCLIDAMPELLSTGCDVFTIDVRHRTGAYARTVSTAYSEALGHTLDASADLTRLLAALKKKVMACAIGGITAGHFHRGPG